jgi:hypothetical protein
MEPKNMVKGTTCFAEHECRNLTCEKKTCRLWMPDVGSLNCAVLAANRGEHTLQEIGDIFGVTRMRICQLEKIVLSKLNDDSTIFEAV